MDDMIKKEMLKTIEITKDSTKNVLDLFIESYTEISSKLDLLAHIIINERK